MANGTDGNLNVIISANVNDLKKGLTQAERGIKKFDTSTKKMTGSTKKMTGGLVKGAVPAMTSFSQVVQDAPFGIRGVANNIQQLTMQMGHLSANAGGTKNALKAMVKTLAGPAGILLVVSIVTSLLVSFGDTLFSTTKKADKLAKAQEALAKSLEDYEASLKNIDKAQLKGSKSAAKELTTLRLLAAQIENTNLSTEKRVEAIDDLRKQYPSYLKGMKDEGILANGLTSIYDKLSAEILKKAKAQAAASLITENTKKQLILESKLRAKQIETINKSTKVTLAEGKKENEIITIGTKLFSAKNIAAAAVNTSLKEETKIQEQIIDLQKESLKLANFISEQGGIVPLDFKVANDFKGIFDASKLAVSKGFSELSQLSALESDKLNKRIKAQLEAEKKLKIKFGIILTPPTQQGLSEEFLKMKLTMKLALEDFNESANKIIQGGITDTFAGLGMAIGDALSGGANIIEGASAALLGGIGSMMVQLGKMAIGIGVGIKAIKTALLTLNPVAAIGAGIALVALGSIFKKGASDIAGGSSGGSRGGGLGTDFSGGNRSSGSSIRATGGGFSGGTVVFEIAGTKLIGVIDNTLKRNRTLGGSNNLLLS